jgi:CO/xanthine dehydrogenase Mo-binding subunit
MNTHFTPSRRKVLKGSGALVVSFSFAGSIGEAIAQGAAPAGAAGAAAKPVAVTEVDSFLAIDPKGMVTVYSGKIDFGTGIRTAMAQIAADELDVPFSAVKVIEGDTLLTPDQGKTWGSLSIQAGGIQLRNAAATAPPWWKRRRRSSASNPTRSRSPTASPRPGASA